MEPLFAKSLIPLLNRTIHDSTYSKADPEACGRPEAPPGAKRKDLCVYYRALSKKDEHSNTYEIGPSEKVSRRLRGSEKAGGRY